jgi:MFS family permease
VPLIPPLVARARGHAGRFPRPFWVLIEIAALGGLAWGAIVPYWALYLTGTLHASGAQAGGLIALAGGAGIVGAPLGGLLADRLGRRPTLLIGLALNAIWVFLYGASSSLLLIALLTLIGVGGDIWSVGDSAAITDLVPAELRTEAFGLRRQVQNVTFAVGAPLGSLLALVGSLRWVFFLAAALAALSWLLVWRDLPETRPVRGEGEPPPRLREAARDLRLLALALGTGIAVIVYVQFDSVLGVFLHEERGYALAAWGAVFGINPIMVALFQYPVARWAGRRSPRAVLALGTVLQGAALLLLVPASPLAVLVVSIVVLTIGEMLLSPVASAVAGALAPPHLRGSYQGVIDVAFAAFFAPGVLSGLWLVGSGHGELMLVLALPLSIVAALCFLPLPRRPVETEDVLPVPAEATVAAP